jgi:hypothetical protein
MSNKQFLIGCALPMLAGLILSVLCCIFTDYERSAANYLTRNIPLPVFVNISKYSSHEFFYMSFFITNVILIPIMSVYWWRYIPGHFKGKVRKSNLRFNILFFIGGLLLVALFISVWFINPEYLSERRRLFYVVIFESPILFYLIILFPMVIVSFVLTGMAKFYYLKVKLVWSIDSGES